ncbi:MAG TPA: YegS/Rv2252/BmrU family lipid kinase [Flavisolibacter sp.]|jgi:YegS/Rv2252/BmrU family lipid kinase
MTLPRNIALLVNPLHQKALRVGNEIVTILLGKSVEHSVFTTSWPTDFMDYTEVWIAGGDGTLNYFINHYPQFNLPMAIFKGGTGNDFHWALYGEISVAEQVEKVLTATQKPVDAGYCNNHLFLNGVGIGFDGKVVQDMLGIKSWSDKLSYYKVVLKNIFFFKEFLCTVSNESFNWGKKCLMLSVANGRRYGGGFNVNPEGLVNDHLLDVYIIGRIPPMMRFRYLPLIEKGTHVNLPMITYLKTGAIHIKTAGIVPAHADGEYFDASEFVIECLPAKFFFLY